MARLLSLVLTAIFSSIVAAGLERRAMIPTRCFDGDFLCPWLNGLDGIATRSSPIFLRAFRTLAQRGMQQPIVLGVGLLPGANFSRGPLSGSLRIISGFLPHVGELGLSKLQLQEQRGWKDATWVLRRTSRAIAPLQKAEHVPGKQPSTPIVANRGQGAPIPRMVQCTSQMVQFCPLNTNVYGIQVPFKPVFAVETKTLLLYLGVEACT
ncbi:hypothetical protein C8F04DRAFT_1234907 [Mycena alexandri]|uniref:Uncharacterized protein n=1 Tax=Mycena alexandri TaxID=1745969 RepID=A0AAD6SVT3_9AGAR|nr:hypothetical protein C8F04DRAFT_1234907 [Mycena alexandri]